MNEEPGTRGSQTLEGDILGTPSYMSPEQVRGPDETDEQSDVFLLGGILYAILTGKPPYSGKTTAAILQKAARGELVPPGERAPRRKIPSALEAVCLKALHRDKAQRYATVRDLMDDVTRFLQFKPVAARKAGPLERSALFVQKHPAFTMATGLIAVVVILAATFGLILSARAREKDALARAQAALARAEGVRAQKAEVEALQAKDALVKGRRVSAVLRAADREMGENVRGLKREFYKPPEAEKSTTAAVEGILSKFARSVPPDEASQAAWLACQGWILHLADRPEKASEAFHRSKEIDPDVAVSPVFQAMDLLQQVLVKTRPPLPVIHRSGVSIRRLTEESPELARIRRDIGSLLEEATRSGGLGEMSGDDLKAVLQGVRAIHEGKYALAEKGLDRALLIPELVWIREEILLARARVKYLRKRFSEALVDLDQVLASLPDHFEGRLFRGVLLVARTAHESRDAGKRTLGFREAVTEFRKTRNDFPRSPVARYMLSMALNTLGEALAAAGEDPRSCFEEGLAEVHQYVTMASHTPDILYLRGELQKNLADANWHRGEDAVEMFRNAISDMSRALAGAGPHRSRFNSRGLCYWSLGRIEAEKGRDASALHEKAIADFSKALDMDPRFSEALMNRGNVYATWAKSLGQRSPEAPAIFEKAIADHTQAIALDQSTEVHYVNRAVARRLLATNLAGLGRESMAMFELCAKDASEAVRRNPQSFKAHMNLGTAIATMALVQEHKGVDSLANLERAAESLETAAGLSPDNAMVWYNLAMLRNQIARARLPSRKNPAPDLERAIEAARASIRINARFIKAYQVLARSHGMMADIQRATGKPVEICLSRAADALDGAIRLDPSNGAIRIQRADYLRQARRFREALIELEEADRLLRGTNAGVARQIEQLKEILAGD